MLPLMIAAQHGLANSNVAVYIQATSDGSAVPFGFLVDG